MSGTQSQAAAAAATTTEAEGGLLDAVIGATRQTEPDRAKELISALTAEALKGTVKFDRNLLITFNRAIEEIDRQVSRQLNAIMHNERFLKLEGSWRGLHYLINNSETGTSLKILKRGRRFELSFEPAVIDEETEGLYDRYLETVKFEAAPSCWEYLHDEGLPDPFDTERVVLRDKGRLIAAGYYDRGRESMMGVLNFYDPEYGGYSPGKLLFLLMIHHAIEGGFRYFYPGSLLVDDVKLDYKLFAGKESITTFLPVEKEWRDYTEWDKFRMNRYFSSHLDRYFDSLRNRD
jgi:hypothetical protein